MPGVPRFSSPRCALYKVFSFSSSTLASLVILDTTDVVDVICVLVQSGLSYILSKEESTEGHG